MCPAYRQSAAAWYLRLMLRVTDKLGHVPTVDEYKEVQARLAGAGEDVPPLR